MLGCSGGEGGISGYSSVVVHVIITGYPGNNKLSALAQQQGTNAALAANLVLA